jgi:lysylphosphatidylglycerol synthetase-like protein (DUF2156 family)
MMSAVQHQPTGAAFDLVLLLHSAAAVVGLATTVTAAASGTRLRRVLRSTAPLPDAVQRYFRPGVNWAGRIVYAVPVLGAALVAMSHGAYSWTDPWIVAGVVLFTGVVLLCEGVAWPAERRLQAALGTAAPDAPRLQRDATALARSAATAAVLLLAAVVVMVAQP